MSSPASALDDEALDAELPDDADEDVPDESVPLLAEAVDAAEVVDDVLSPLLSLAV